MTALVLLTKSRHMFCPAAGLWFATGSGNEVMNNAITLTSVVGNIDKQ